MMGKSRRKGERIEQPVVIQRPSKKLHLFVFFLIALIGTAVYANSLKGAFFWDDIGLIKDNFLIKNWSYLPRLFSLPLSSTFHYCYRPLLNLSFMVDYSIWQLNPFGYHASAVLLHIFNSCLVYILIFLLGKDWKLAMASGLIFAVHSVLSESVNYLSSRGDLLMALFCLSSLILYILYKTSSSNKLFYFGSLFLFILGLMSKEMAIVLIFTLILYELIIRPGENTTKRRLFSILPYLVVLAIYAILRYSILKANVPVFMERFSIAELSFGQRFFTSLSTIPTYLRLMIFPVDLHKEWLFVPVEPILQFKVIFSLTLVVAAALLAKFIYRYSRLCAFGILWFFILLAPVSNILPLNSFFSEAWLYLPSVGFILFVCALTLKIIPPNNIFNRSVLVILLIGILLFFSSLTIKRNHVWASDRKTFFSDIVKHNPYSSRAHTNLGLIAVEEDKLNEAIEEFVKALEIEPENAGLHRNMGNVYLRQNKLSLAEKAYKKALSINPNDSETLGNLGNLYSKENNLNEAIGYTKKALDINPYNDNLYNSLGTIYFKQNNLNGAADEYRKAISVSPDNAKAHANLGIVYYHQKKTDQAIVEFNSCLRLDSTYIDAYYNLGVIYFSLGQHEKAKHNLNKTILLAQQQNKAAFAQNAQNLLKQLP